jgi:trans-aconitate methyltransferase
LSEKGSSTEERARLWDKAYTDRGVQNVSWYQEDAAVSLELIGDLGLTPDAAVIDVGGGASSLAERLVARGFIDVSVLDVSAAALAEARQQAGDDAPIQWLHEDLLLWQPERRYDLWHDAPSFISLSMLPTAPPTSRPWWRDCDQEAP